MGSRGGRFDVMCCAVSLLHSASAQGEGACWLDGLGRSSSRSTAVTTQHAAQQGISSCHLPTRAVLPQSRRLLTSLSLAVALSIVDLGLLARWVGG